jgi:cytosine/uracil/thiamine/allantoin permease
MVHNIVGIVGYTITFLVAFRFGLTPWQAFIVLVLAALTTAVKLVLMTPEERAWMDWRDDG